MPDQEVLLPKDYHITEITITTLTGQEVDLQDLVMELNIHEDIFNNTIYGDVVIADAKNRVSNLPITGFETLVVDFETPNKANYRKTFRIYGVTDKGLGREKAMLYIIRFTSQEQLTNSMVKVQKSYIGKQIHDIVNDIHVNFLKSSSDIILEATKFMHSFVIPNWSPFRTINWLAVRANSSFYNGANYLFFENKFGFNFQSAETLIKNNISGYNFVDQPLNISSDGPHKDRDYSTDSVTMDSFKFLHHIQVLENIDRGMYGNSLLTFDPIQKDWSTTTYSYKDEWDNMIHMENNKVSGDSGTKNTFLLPNTNSEDFSTSVTKFYPMNGRADYPNKVEEWLPKRLGRMQELQNVRVHLTVPGNSELTVGQSAKMTLYSPEPPNVNDQPVDPYYSGTYLITSVRHSIASKKYVTILELVKDSLFSALP